MNDSTFQKLATAEGLPNNWAEIVTWLTDRGVTFRTHHTETGAHSDLEYLGRVRCMTTEDIVQFAETGFDSWLGKLLSKSEVAQMHDRLFPGER